MKRVIVLIAIVFVTATLYAQKPFSGKIEFAISMTGEGADQLAAFMPNSYQYFIDGSNVLFRMEGGLTAAMMGDVVINNNTGESYMLKHGEKTAYKIGDDEDGEDIVKDIKVTKMDEKIEIQGYKCQKYKVTAADGVTQYVWTTTEINIKKPRSKVNSQIGGGNLFMEGLEGFPLKMMTSVPGTGMTMVMTADKISAEKPDKNMFIIPDSYEIKDFDPSSLGF